MLKNIKAAPGYVILKTDNHLIDEIKYKSLILKTNPTYEMYANTKISAEVVDVSKKLPDTPFFTKNPGYPAPVRKFLPDGDIYCTPYRDEYITSEMQDNPIRPGDHVYCHYLSFHGDSMIGEEDGFKYFKTPYSNIFCSIEDSGPKMTNGYILVEPYYGEGFIEISVPELTEMARPTGKERKLRVHMTRSGIVYDIFNEPVANQGIVRNIGGKIAGIDFGYSEGDKVMFAHNKHFKNKIEGKEYYVMRQWDVLAVSAKDGLRPINDYVMMEVEKPEKETSIIGLKSAGKYQGKERFRMDEAKPTRGRVLSVGNNCQYVRPGDKVCYGWRSTWAMNVEEHDVALIKENQIWATYE